MYQYTVNKIKEYDNNITDVIVKLKEINSCILKEISIFDNDTYSEQDKEEYIGLCESIDKAVSCLYLAKKYLEDTTNID